MKEKIKVTGKDKVAPMEMNNPKDGKAEVRK